MQSVFTLCRGDPEEISNELDRPVRWLVFCLLVIVLGSGLYGATIGLWRSPLQALYTGLKFPLLILFTTLGNALINGMLAQVLGLGISFRASSLSIVTSFAIASAILASLVPISLFMWFNTPALTDGRDALLAHNFTLLAHVLIIALAGVAGNARLLWLLRYKSGHPALAGKILAAWLIINMFLGCQLSWIMRPFVGSPGLPVEFFREDAFRGTFYESTYTAFTNLITAKDRSTPDAKPEP